MYKSFKSILTRPVGDPLLDKFQRDVVEALKAFVLTNYSKDDTGLVPAPGTNNHTQILYDAGWGPLPVTPTGTTYFPGGW